MDLACFYNDKVTAATGFAEPLDLWRLSLLAS